MVVLWRAWVVWNGNVFLQWIFIIFAISNAGEQLITDQIKFPWVISTLFASS
ncbi:hypothetical protein GYMLUDRAFT_780937 [Collybiopsis luxurians FD-317 M1]|uniref:Uncharacterized protein n=1 Tax=Collybiopsis luxurians FD-317 M1 TaxID=944289 RepID=A0A0D0C2W7_9AGAR|nr:hypothetical protein GYMLUDRAFT_780937 [Collybiopsis luxurians FD-317 M1]